MFSAREQEVYTKALSDPDTVRASLESNIGFDMFNKLSDSDRDCILRMNKDPEFLLSVLNDRKHPYTIDFVKLRFYLKIFLQFKYFMIQLVRLQHNKEYKCQSET